MPASVVDQIFARHEAVDPTGARAKVGRGGGGGGRGVQKTPRPPRPTLAGSFLGITDDIKMEKAVRALGTMAVCERRQGELAAQLTKLEWPTVRMGMGPHEPQRDPDEQAVYDEERARLAAIHTEAENELVRLFDKEVGPPLNLQAVVQQRKARSAQQSLEAQMADMAMGDEPESPAPSFASTGNPRFQRDQQAQQNRSAAANAPRFLGLPADESVEPAQGSTNPYGGGPAYRSLGSE
jgi:hypothetical protein